MGKVSKYHVSKITVCNSDKCQKEFSCLEGDNPLCPVESLINEKVLFVKCISKGHCSYRRSYGDGYICFCPTRREIFKKYGK